MIVAAPGPTPAQTQSREWFGWGIKLQLDPGGAAQGKPHLILEHCTFDGVGLLDLTSNSASMPLLVEVNHCAIRAEALLACKQGGRAASAPILWRGEANQYDIFGQSWTVLSASQGTPAPTPTITDLASWLKFAPDDRSPIPAKLKFMIDPAARLELPRPRDFTIIAPEPPLTKPGANPDQSARDAAVRPLRHDRNREDPLMASQHVEESTSAHSSATLTAPAHHAGQRASLAALVLGALGVVFGDIGTSPLYTLKECLHAAGVRRPALRICSGSCR